MTARKRTFTPSDQKAHQPASTHAMADATATAEVARRYDRFARVYDAVEAPMDLLGGRRRRDRTVGAAHGATLEVGIGTGRNLDHYPRNVELTGIDISTRMLARARRRADQRDRPVRLEVADVERLPFPDASFDTVCATCVFCSVANPVAGLREVARVVRPDGQVRLLEHVRPRTRLLGWLADRLSPLTQRLVGPALNRRTEDNARASGLDLVEVRRHGVWREIWARPADAPRDKHRGDDRADEPRSTEEVAPAKCCGGHRADEAPAQEPSPSRPG